MGYFVEKYVICDGCGCYRKNVFKNKQFGEGYYRIWAENNGWEIRKDGWFCPKCKRGNNDGKAE
jgi:hypothetical protein